VNSLDPAEAQFEAYLEERGITGAEDHHPDLGGDKKPDYRISRGGPAAIVELKGITTSRMQERVTGSKGSMVLSDDDVYGTARNTIKKATRQLRPYADRGEALIVAIANPRKFWTPTEDAEETIAVLHGNPTVAIPIATGSGEAVGEARAFCDQDGVFGGGLHRYVSASSRCTNGPMLPTRLSTGTTRTGTAGITSWSPGIELSPISSAATTGSPSPKRPREAIATCGSSRPSPPRKVWMRLRSPVVSSMGPTTSYGPSIWQPARSDVIGRGSPQPGARSG